MISEEFKLAEGATTQAKKEARSRAKLDMNKLATDLGVDIKVFELNQSRLGEQILSAAEARKDAMKEIARGKVQADFQADAARMLPVRMAPDPPRPYKAEMPTMLPPPEPMKQSPGSLHDSYA